MENNLSQATDASSSVAIVPLPPASPGRRQQSAQRRLIAQARELLAPSPVTVGVVPGWLRRRMLTACGHPPYDTNGHTVLRHALAQCGGHSWLDHAGVTVCQGREAFCSEPYGVGPADLQSLNEFCRRCGLSYEISANSWHYPGATVRIVIWRPEVEAAEPAGGATP